MKKTQLLRGPTYPTLLGGISIFGLDALPLIVMILCALALFIFLGPSAENKTV